MKKLLFLFIALAILGVGCTNAPVVQTPALVVPTSTTITYYITPSGISRDMFCNGGDMNSGAYKKMLTQKVTKAVPGNLTLEEKIKTTLTMAAADPKEFDETNGNPYTRSASTTVENEIVTLHPASGWAGSSIFMCAWQPFVEKQLEQFPELKKIEWKEVQ